jgi:hypothetical protein
MPTDWVQCCRHRAVDSLLQRELHRSGPTDPSILVFPNSQALRICFRGETQKALDRLAAIRSEAEAGGQILSVEVWITPLSIWREESPGAIAECWGAA